MRQTLSCVLAVSVLVASTGCHVANHRASSDMGGVEAAACWAETGCEDGRCQAASMPVGETYCADAAICGDGSCGTGGRCRAALATMRHKLGQHGGRGCRGLNCGMAVGPNTGAAVYPYYTVRGPRDFLVDNPPSIGR